MVIDVHEFVNGIKKQATETEGCCWPKMQKCISKTWEVIFNF